jgi:hypothetical protein
MTACFGQVCGKCPLGWALIAKGCNECPPEEQLAPLRNAVMAIFVLICLIIWYIVSWRPLFSDVRGVTLKEVKGKLTKVQGIIQSIKSLPEKMANMRDRIYQNLGDDIQVQLEGLTRDRMIQYLKLYITYFQVVSSFLTFSVKWPDLLRSSMVWIKSTLFLDILQLPGFACLWTGIAFTQQLLTYTLGPLVVSLCLVMPCIFGWLAGYRDKKPAQWEAASNAAWKNMMFWVFLVYPVVSLTTLQAFDCQPEGLGLLAVDRNMKCPSGLDFLQSWSIAFIFVYPIGIPLFCFISMLGMGVHLLAQDKINSNILSSIVAKYMQVTTSIESHRIAGLFKSEDADSPADPEVLLLWKSLKDRKQYVHEDNLTNIKVQGVDVNTISKLVRDSVKNTGDDISLELFVKILNQEKRIVHIYNSFFDCNGRLKSEETCMTLSGVDFGSMQRFVEKYDQDGDHLISMDEFRDMVKAVIFDTSLFTGVEGDRLTKNQAIALLTFDWKSILPRPTKVGVNSKPQAAEKKQKKVKKLHEEGGASPQQNTNLQDSTAAGDILAANSVVTESETTQLDQNHLQPGARNSEAGEKTIKIESEKDCVMPAQQTVESFLSAQEKVHTGIDTANTAMNTGRIAKESGQKISKLGFSAAKHVGCCSHEMDSDEDTAQVGGNDTEKNNEEEDEKETPDGDEDENNSDDNETEAKPDKDIWKDKTFLQVACERHQNKVAAEIWKLGDMLLKNKVISVPDVVWTQSEHSSATKYQDDSPVDLKRLSTDMLKDFIIHPDIEDEYRQQNYISKLFMLISLFSTSLPESWKSVNKRKALEAKAMLRAGFVFSAYKVNFWYWEMIEMTRK